MGNLGTTELILILLVVLVFFGARKIPELAQGLGNGIKEFKKATRELEETSTEVAKAGDDAIGIKEVRDSLRGFHKVIRKSTKT